tara:strand:+ start:285 stop:584 length:300 start_codon:yes stop_codon:yes gene_type:complete
MVWQPLQKKAKRSIVINALNTMGMNIESTTSWFELKEVCENNGLNANKILQESYSKPIGFTAPAEQPKKAKSSDNKAVKTASDDKTPTPTAKADGDYIV